MEENKSPWNRLSERKPEDGANLIVIQFPADSETGRGHKIVSFGGPVDLSLLEYVCAKRLDDTYWIELPE